MIVDQLREVPGADVWKAGRLAARLQREPQGVVFRYVDGYDGPPVACSLPRDVGELRLAGGALPPFFTGLLPEGRRLSAIRAAAKTSADDELTLLLVVGADTIGDVQVLPRGTDPDAAPSEPDRPALADLRFAELYPELLSGRRLDRTAIAGAQDKVSGAMISLPLAYRDAAWILKLDPPELPHLVRNESFFLTAARRSGLDVVHTELVHDRDGVPGLLVRRFDRVGGAAGERRAVEDACQVLGRYPADKYRVTTEQVVDALATRTQAPLVAARTLLHQLAFAYASCNGDAHAKNFSVVQRDGEWRIAPAYDLPSTQPYRDTTMALSLNGKTREDIGRADFLALGERCGVPAKAVARVLDEVVAAAPAWIDRLDELPFDARRIHRLRRACRHRVERLAAPPA
ncbi:MAG: HipA domain-containing protein [Planctomycetes bacterium]|nr:HipA domain-containing protein [Planctomycetota bacterium]